MKHECECCRGTGHVTCDECDGTGEVGTDIEHMNFDRLHPRHSELMDLKNDAVRCREQAEKLIEMNPFRRESYERQLAGCLAQIEAEATEVLKKR